MPMSETANRKARASGGAARALVGGVALLASVIIPVMGYGTLLASHASEGPPHWVYFAIPAALAGPDIPSLVQFVGLAAANVLLWFFIAYWIAKGVVWGVGMSHRDDGEPPRLR
jgi:hypothetical protein